MKRPYGPCLTCKVWVPMLQWSSVYNKRKSKPMTLMRYRGKCDCGMTVTAEGTIDEPPRPPELEVEAAARRTMALPECPKCQRALFLDGSTDFPYCVSCGYEDYGYHQPSKYKWTRRE
jgi:Zn ribbon nucleic-acid-binding protein